MAAQGNGRREGQHIQLLRQRGVWEKRQHGQTSGRDSSPFCIHPSPTCAAYFASILHPYVLRIFSSILHPHILRDSLTQTQAGAPLRLHSVGQDFFQGSHYDEYIYTFTSFKPGPIRDSSVFQVPDLCTKARDDGSMAHVERQVVSRRAASLLPGNHAEHKGAQFFGSDYKLSC